MNRRTFIASSAPALITALAVAQSIKAKRICVAALWHTVNIGDIAHGPGLVRLIEHHLPGVDVTLWAARSPTEEIRAMLRQHFPRLTIIEGTVSPDGKPSSPELASEIAHCDMMILASGGYHPFPVEGWRHLSSHPYGVFGNGFDHWESLTPALADQLGHAQFVYGRETASSTNLQRLGVKAPGLTFCPDSTFGFDLRDDSRADTFMQHTGLKEGEFICVIPMLRYAPHWKLYGKAPRPADLAGEETNAKFKEQDHAAVRELIIGWVRQTGLKVLACPEMTYEVALAKEVWIDPLPEDVKPRVVWRETFWMPDEATSVYARSVAVISLECHSPILALANGTPAIHIRLPSETKKGQMFADIGLGEWLHEVTDITGPKLTAQVLAIHANREAARAKVTTAMKRVSDIYRDVFTRVTEVLRA